MKNLMTMFRPILICLLSLPAFAGPNASGGVPETNFEHDYAAVTTILKNTDLRSMLRNKGSIQSILPVQSYPDTYAIKTEKCEVSVQFVRTCTFDMGLPQCDYDSKILENEMRGDCK